MAEPPAPGDVLAVLIQLAEETLPDRRIGAEDALLGPDAQMDSMELVSYVVDVQEVAFERWQRDIVLADERALSRTRSPFRTLAALAELVVERLHE